uniref:Uncharacterized protein n=1 Tax=Echinococcus canadensis TaxID=519352 RepID=A0A915EYK4_9CEST
MGEDGKLEKKHLIGDSLLLLLQVLQFDVRGALVRRSSQVRLQSAEHPEDSTPITVNRSLLVFCRRVVATPQFYSFIVFLVILFVLCVIGDVEPNSAFPVARRPVRPHAWFAGRGTTAYITKQTLCPPL